MLVTGHGALPLRRPRETLGGFVLQSGCGGTVQSSAGEDRSWRAQTWAGISSFPLSGSQLGPLLYLQMWRIILNAQLANANTSLAGVL